jgi:hypothetical protein
MSHNKIKAAGSEPNRESEVTVNLANLSDISGTLAADKYLVYDGSNFVVTDKPTPSSVDPQVIFIGDGGTNNYPRTLTEGEEVCFYSASPYNSITGASLNLLSGETNWYESVTLPAGKYYFRGACIGDFTASSNPNMAYRFAVTAGGTRYGTFGASYDDIASGGSYPYESAAFISLSTGTTIVLEITGVNNANSTTTSNQSKYGHLYIMRVST